MNTNAENRNGCRTLQKDTSVTGSKDSVCQKSRSTVPGSVGGDRGCRRSPSAVSDLGNIGSDRHMSLNMTSCAADNSDTCRIASQTVKSGPAKNTNDCDISQKKKITSTLQSRVYSPSEYQKPPPKDDVLDKYYRMNRRRAGARRQICAQALRMFNTLRPKQDGRLFPDDIFKCIFFNEYVSIFIRISLTFVPKAPINNIPAWVQIMAWRRSGDKPLSEPMMVSLVMHICVTQPQWVNMWREF